MLGWNIVAWNFLSANRERNVKFIPSQWTKSDQPGLYISYTYARILKALRKSADTSRRVRLAVRSD
jgi:arginyl-tRNA synthetase